jgi:CubicO group peptidase (beta-lactamase class C family)
MMTTLMEAPRISGRCDALFSAVADAFDAAARQDPSAGMTMAICHRDQVVVDLWSGLADVKSGKKWDANTLVCMMSVAKGVSALCLHLLADRDLIELDAPVHRYWPEFVSHGKDAILVRHVLDHSAGIPYVDVPAAGVDALEQRTMEVALERAVPLAPPGQMRGYHPVTMGYLAGAIVRRVAGISLGAFFQREVASVHGLDYWIGLPKELHERCAAIGGDVEGTIFGAAKREPGTMLGRCMKQVTSDLLNLPEFRSMQVPAINGHGNAAAIAKMYGLLAHQGEATILSAGAIERATTLQWSDVEQTMHHARNMAMGFILTADNVPMGPGPRSFGHPGAGGSIGFADPHRELGVCFAANTLYADHGVNPHMVSVCNAAFRAFER